MLFYVETIDDFNNNFGVDDERYYNSPETVFENALSIIVKNNLFDIFSNKLTKIIKNAPDGFGHMDILEETYEGLLGFPFEP